MIVKLKGGNGTTIHEIDTNTVVDYPLPPRGDAAISIRYGNTKKVIMIDRDEWSKLYDAMNAPRP